MTADKKEENKSGANRWPHWGTKPYKVMPHISPESKRIGETYQLRPSDVVVLSFPKTGEYNNMRLLSAQLNFVFGSFTKSIFKTFISKEQLGHKTAVSSYELELVDMTLKILPSANRG